MSQDYLLNHNIGIVLLRHFNAEMSLVKHLKEIKGSKTFTDKRDGHP